MLKIRRRFFLLVAVFGLVLTLASCVKSSNYVQLELDSEVYYVKVGETWDIAPAVSKGDSIKVVTLNYSSSNEKVATYADGKVVGVSAGETTIKVVCAEKPIAYDVATVIVVNDRLPVATFGAWTKEVLKKQSQTLTYTLKDVVPGHDVNVKFESKDETVATVDQTGKVEAVGAGETVIVATVYDNEDSKAYEFALKVNESEFAITYNLNGGTNNPENADIYCLLDLPFVLQDPQREGCEFLGWYTDEACTKPIEKIEANVGPVTVYAKWYDPEAVLDVTYDLAGGEFTEEVANTFVAKDGIPTLPTPVKLGYEFAGWYAGTTKVEAVEAARLEGIALTAKWTEVTYNVKYELDGGEFQREVLKYKTIEDLAKAFVADYAKFYSLSNVTPESFYGASASRGVKVFFQNHADWAWLLTYIYEKATVDAPSMKHFFTMQADNIQFNKYVRVNLMALFGQGSYNGEVASMTFSKTVEDASYIALCPTVMEGKDAKETVKISELSYTLETPYKEGFEFVGWALTATETEAANMLTVIDAATLKEAVNGTITLYAIYKAVTPTE